ncbi:hypothetical protein KGQ55_01120 [Patescibacteria group bacterium]|nr:hypothetical protein [Patescibacteria group bacterium]
MARIRITKAPDYAPQKLKKFFEGIEIVTAVGSLHIGVPVDLEKLALALQANGAAGAECIFYTDSNCVFPKERLAYIPNECCELLPEHA